MEISHSNRKLLWNVEIFCCTNQNKKKILNFCLRRHLKTYVDDLNRERLFARKHAYSISISYIFLMKRWNISCKCGMWRKVSKVTKYINTIISLRGSFMPKCCEFFRWESILYEEYFQLYFINHVKNKMQYSVFLIKCFSLCLDDRECTGLLWV